MLPALTIVVIVLIVVLMLPIVYFGLSAVTFHARKVRFVQRCQQLDAEFVQPTELQEVIIAGLGYNIAKNVPLIKELAASVGASHVFILENNSTDGTRGLLEMWQLESAERHIVLPPVSEEIAARHDEAQFKGHGCARIQRMVKLRNSLLDSIRATVPHHKGVLVYFDLDLPLVYSKHELVENIAWLKAQASTNAVTPNLRKNLYYCGFASFLRDSFAVAKENKYTMSEDHDWLDSAFGGFTVYKTQAALDNVYTVNPHPTKKNHCLCEHVPFHKKIGGVILAKNWEMLV